MPILPPSPSMSGMGASPAMSGMPAQQPSYGGTSSLLYQPSGGEMSDPRNLLATVFRKMMDLVDAVNTQFPGGEEKINEGMQQIGVAFAEKIQRLGGVEPLGPPTAA